MQELRFFRSALSRLFCARRYALTLCAAFALALFSVPFLDLVRETMAMVTPEVADTFRSGGVYHIGALSLSSLDASGEDILAGIFSGAFALQLIVFTVASFLYAERVGGYLLIALARGQSRSRAYAQYLTLSALSALSLLMFLQLGVVLSLHFQGMLSVQFPLRLTAVLLTQTLMLCAVALCVAAFCLTAGKGQLVLAAMGGTLLLQMLPRYLTALAHRRLWIERWLLLSWLENSCQLELNQIPLCAAVTFATALLCSLIGFALFRARHW